MDAAWACRRHRGRSCVALATSFSRRTTETLSATYAVPVLRRLRAGVRPADGWIALSFMLADAVEVAIRYHGDRALLVSNLLGSVTFGCLALRRTRPLLTVSVLTAVFSAGSVIQAAVVAHRSENQFVPIFALLVVSYSVGAYATRRQLLWAAWQPVLLVLVVDLTEADDNSLVAATVFVAVFVCAAPVAAGRLVRGRNAIVRRLREQARQIEAQRRSQIDAAVAAERLRMTDRFHRTLVSGMQSLADRLRSTDAAPSESEIGRIEEAARELLSQTRREVVSLTGPRNGLRDALEPPAPPARSADAAQPWTVLAGAALCAGLLVETRTLPLHVPLIVAWAACIAVSVPLALAWLRPLPMITTLQVLTALFVAFVAPLDKSFTAIGLSFVPPFLVAAIEPRRRALLGLVVCGAGVVATSGSHAAAGNVAVVVCCWLGGAILYERIRLVDQLRANNDVLDGQRAAEAMRAVDEERLRVARELHDAVGHSLTVIVLQAGAARRIHSSDPARAHAALSTVTAVAADGLAELQRGSLPGGAPDLRSVDDLLDTARAAGLCLDARVEDVAAELDPDARFVVYRVVQEALTNILKHAPGAPAELLIAGTGSRVDIVIANGAPIAAVASPSGGHGLRGMQARVEACGGRVYWAPLAGGGFEVRAHVPAVPGPR